MKARIVRVVILCVALLILAVGPGLALGFPPDANLEIAAPQGSLSNAPWFIETIESTDDVGQYVSIVIHPDSGVTYISYYDATNNDLRMATYVGSGGNCGEDNAWSCEVVDDGGAADDNVGKYNSIDIYPPTGRPAIAYYDSTNGALKYAWLYCYPTCSWVIVTIDKKPTAFADRGLYTSLDFLDYDNIPVIAYYRTGFSNWGELKVAWYTGTDGNCGEGDAAGKWQCDVIDSGEGVGKYASLYAYTYIFTYLDVAYYDQGNGDLKWASFSGQLSATGADGTTPEGNCGPGNTWECSIIDSTGDVGRYASVGLDSHGIAYYDATNESLKYAQYVTSGGNCGPTNNWQCDTIETMGSSTLPMGISLVKDWPSSEYPIIAYQSVPDEFSPGMLKVARPVAALGQLVGNCGPVDPMFYSWQCDTIDRGGDIFFEASYVAIAVNSGGLATIAYHEEDEYFNTDNLKVAYQRVQLFLPLVRWD